MKYLFFRLKRFCGFAIGFVFYISGLLKLMDPIGAGLVMAEYFRFLHISFLEPAAYGFGVGFALTEAILGTALITGVWRRLIAPVVVGLQGFFTLLTLALVIFKPEMDCGCFGEAIHLTHTETFGKNIIILGLLLIYYIPAKYLGETKKKKYVSFAVVSLSTVAFAIYSMLYLPMADFTTFRPGTQINRTTEASDTYEAIFIYSKDGKEESFNLENIPDSTWTFVRTESASGEAVNDSPAMVSIYNSDGEYADSLLSMGKIISVTIYKADLTTRDTKDINCLIENARATGFTPMVLSVAEVEGLDIPVYQCDYKTLITLNRSNGGATYINDGFIIRKWAKRALPDLEDLATLSDEDPTDTFIGRDTGTSLAFQGFLLYVFAVMLLL